MDDHQLLRYSRHILLPEIDLEGQERLLAATVLIVGCGGLGNAVAPYLAASGVGRLILVDHDHIELSNLQRQICFTPQDVGSPKAEVLARTIQRQNPEIQIEEHTQRADAALLQNWMRQSDIVLDCTDNFQTRKAINMASVQTGTPLVSAAVTRFEGQLALFDPREKHSPCYACLFDGEDASDGPCATFGVFSPLVGMMGSLQALTTLKLLAAVGTSELGVLYQYDALQLSVYPLRFAKNPHCPICGNHSSLK